MSITASRIIRAPIELPVRSFAQNEAAAAPGAVTGGYSVVPAAFRKFGAADVFSFVFPGVGVGGEQVAVDVMDFRVGDYGSAVAADKAAEAVPVGDVFFGGYAEFGVGGKDDNRDYGREVVPALEAVSDGFDVAAVLVYGIE